MLCTVLDAEDTIVNQSGIFQVSRYFPLRTRDEEKHFKQKEMPRKSHSSTK